MQTFTFITNQKCAQLVPNSAMFAEILLRQILLVKQINGINYYNGNAMIIEDGKRQ